MTVKDTAGNVVFAEAIAAVQESIKRGDTVAEPLAASNLFPPALIGMVDVGEQTGALPGMLLKVADVYDDQGDNSIAALVSLLEPVMIVFLAVIVGSIVVALFLPLLEAMQRFGPSEETP